MSNINSPELGLRIQKFLKQQGPIRLGTLEEVLFPTISVGDLSGETQQPIFGAYLVTPLNAANGGRTRLCNPTNSRVNIHPVLLNLGQTVSGYWGLQVEPFTAGAIFPFGNGLGVNNWLSQSTVGLIGDTPAGVAALNGAFLVGGQASTTLAVVTLPSGVVIPPGFALGMYTSAINTEQRVGVIWYEEALA